MSTTVVSGRFITLPDAHSLQASVVALEEHGFSVEVVGDLGAAREAVLARMGASVMTNASVTLAETGITDVINDGGGRWESARNKMFALDFASQAQEMKAIGGQPDYALGSVHAVTRDGTLVIASASGASSPPTPGARLMSFSWSARRSWCPPWKPRTSGSISTACRWKTPAHSRPTDSAARSGRSSRSSGTARPDPRRPRPPASRLLNRRASRSHRRLCPMTADARPDDRQPALAPLDEKVDHVRGSPAGRVILEYGDYECPYRGRPSMRSSWSNSSSAGTCGSRSGMSP